MPDHDPDVAAVLLRHWHQRVQEQIAASPEEHIKASLAALAAAGYAVVKLPEGMTVKHGARLVPRSWYRDGAVCVRDGFDIEATP